ncbi:MAG: DNA translocase FtsK, partial [Fretibacterium sp.]|nr:DNA translocase FtsK [Fretibacterium sp.]
MSGLGASRGRGGGVLTGCVSNMALCGRCPRLFAYADSGRNNAWRVGIDGGGNYYGSDFHNRIAAPFFKGARKKNTTIYRELIEAFREGSDGFEARLARLVERRCFNPFLENKNAAGGLSPEPALAAARAADRWARCMARFLLRVPSLFKEPESLLPQVFAASARLKGEHIFEDGQPLRMTGDYDALLFNPDEGGAMLFEFKGYKGSDPLSGLAQALLYCYLVERTTGLLPGLCLIFLEDENPLELPSEKVSEMMASALPPLFDSVRAALNRQKPLPMTLDPFLCARCPFDSFCDSDWGARSVQVPQALDKAAPQVSDEVPSLTTALSQSDSDVLEARGHMARLIDTLKKMKLPATDQGFVCGPSFIRLKVLPIVSQGAKVAKLMSAAKDLQVQMALDVPPLIEAGPGYVGVDVPCAKRRVLTLEELMKAGAADRPKGSAVFPLGMRVDGSVRWADLVEPGMTHILIGGASGSGKSVLLRSIVLGLLLCTPRGSVRFTLIDPKKVTFSDLKGLNALEEGAILSEPDLAFMALEGAVEEMERRYDLLEAAGVSDLESYNAIGGGFLPRRVTIIDEYADLMQDKEMAKNLEHFVQRLSQKGRAAGLHLMLATQRPDARTVTGIIKANLQLRIALKVGSQ